jgi:hypothetical protein
MYTTLKIISRKFLGVRGAVAGIVVAAIILTTVIVLGIAYFVWW